MNNKERISISELDSNGFSDTIEVGIYYYIDDDGKKVYDEECMREEFETLLEQVTNKSMKK
mgnify:CR=1 FL=1|tara:strand:- start:1130 stop:1312 length:183 start_codon:yes stop_codon:yes gene_type:complete